MVCCKVYGGSPETWIESRHPCQVQTELSSFSRQIDDFLEQGTLNQRTIAKSCVRPATDTGLFACSLDSIYEAVLFKNYYKKVESCRLLRVVLRDDLGMPRTKLDIDFNMAQARIMTQMGSG